MDFERICIGNKCPSRNSNTHTPNNDLKATNAQAAAEPLSSPDDNCPSGGFA